MKTHSYTTGNVKHVDETEASAALLRHKAAINRWIMEDGPRPEILEHV